MKSSGVHPDTTLTGSDYTRIRFTSEQGAIIVSIVIKQLLVFESPDEYYKKSDSVTTAEGGRLQNKKYIKLFDGSNTLHIEKKKISDSSDSLIFLQNLLAQVPAYGQVEVAVLSRYETKRDASILFDGILTNFFIAGNRLYSPFKGSVLEISGGE